MEPVMGYIIPTKDVLESFRLYFLVAAQVLWRVLSKRLGLGNKSRVQARYKRHVVPGEGETGLARQTQAQSQQNAARAPRFAAFPFYARSGRRRWHTNTI